MVFLKRSLLDGVVPFGCHHPRKKDQTAAGVRLSNVIRVDALNATDAIHPLKISILPERRRHVYPVACIRERCVCIGRRN